MPPRKNRTLNEIHKQELEDHVMARMEERFDQFVDQLSDQMDQLMNRHGNRNSRGTNGEQSDNPFGEDDDSSSDEQSGRRPRRNQRGDNRRWESEMRFNIPDFAGDTLIPKGFIDWLVAVKEVFEFKEVPENKRVSLIATKLRDRASTWWQQLKLTRDRVGKPRIMSWQKMKKCMRANFIPHNYQRQMYQRLQNLKQGSKSVEDYTTEFYQLIARNDIKETEDQHVSQYIGGLRVQIMDSVNMFDLMTLSDAYQRNMASHFAPSQAKAGGGNTGLVSRASGTSGLKCFNYGEPGHRQSECKKAGKRHLFSDLEGDDAAYEEYEEAPIYDEEPECEEDCDNLIAAEAVQKLGLKTENHPKPYKLQWHKKGGEVKVSKRVHVLFSIGNTYTNNVWCDVVPMDACHLLLVKITLMPNKPKEVVTKPTGTLLTLSQFKDKLEIGDDVFVLIGKEVVEDSEIPKAMIPLLKEFSDVFPDKLPDGLPPLHDIQHHIDLKPRFPIPRLADLLDQISGATIFTRLDLKSGYYQICHRPGDEWKTTFKTREGLYEWPFISKFMVVYFDNILIYNASFNEHVTHVRQVLTLLWKDSFYAAIKKCVFMTPKVLFLRLREGKVICLDGGSRVGFLSCKKKLTTTPILILPDFSKVFELYTDASKVAIGGVLSQGGRPIAYFSEKLTGPKSRHIRTQDKLSHKHGRWLAFLEKFTFVVKHKTSVSNRATNALSRRSGLLVTMQVDAPGLDVIRNMVAVDPYFSVVLHDVQAGEKSDFFLHNRCLVGDHVKAWDQKLCQAEFAHNHAINQSNSFVPKKVQDFVAGLHDVYKVVHENMVHANSKYKQDADHKRRHVDFEESDFVWAVLTKDHFPVGEYNKLSAKKIGSLKINSNAFRLKLPSHIGCSDVFNDLAMNSRTNFIYPGGNDGGKY
ncbi:putative reverse transcriptase domain-containing protein [Tanacetum coccineum]